MKVLSKYQNKHGKRQTVAYKVWDCMIQRCYNPNKSSFKYYGGKGITVFDDWKESFESFYTYVSKLKGYEDKHSTDVIGDRISLERINVNKGYFPGNVKWINRKEQIYNRSISSTNKSGFTGVTFYKRDKTWHSKICVNKKQIHLGYFKNKMDAVAERDMYIKKHNLPHKISNLC